MAISFFVLTLYVAARLTWGQRFPHPTFAVDDDAIIQSEYYNEPRGYGMEPGDRILAVNDTPVSNRRDYFRQVRAQSGNQIRLLIERTEPEGTPHRIEVSWSEVNSFPAFTTRQDLQLANVQEVVAKNIGVRAGDRVVSVNGKAVDSTADYQRALATPYRGRAQTLELARGVNQPVAFVIVYYLLDWKTAWILFVVGLLFGLIGVGSFFVNPHNRSTWAFMIFCAYFGSFWYSRAIPIDYRYESEKLFFYMLLTFLPVPTTHFLVTFSPLRLLISRPRRVLGTVVIACTSTAALGFLMSPGEARVGVLAEPLFIAWLFLMLSLVIVAQPVDLFMRFRGTILTLADRQRGNIIRYATALGFLPILIYTALSVSTHVQWPHARLLAESFVLAFPLIIAYGIIQHNFLQIHDLVRETIVFATISLLTAVTYALVAGLTLPVAENLVEGSSWIGRATILGILVIVAARAYIALHNYIDRKLSGPRMDEQLFMESIDAQADAMNSPVEFCEFLMARLRKRFYVPEVHILLISKVTDSHASDPPDWESTGANDDDCRAIFRILQDSPDRLFIDELAEDFRQPTLRAAAVKAGRSLNCSMIVGLYSHQTVTGAICLGERADLRPFRPAEIESLRRLCRRVSVLLSLLLDRVADHATPKIIDSFPRAPLTIGPFQVLKAIGRGGMSFVYLGEKNGHQAAIKVANHKVQSNEKLMIRFHREADALRRLDHPNIIRILEIGWEATEPYIAIEYFPRGSLKQFLRENGPLQEPLALRLISQSACGLNAAMKEGIVHRDVKPHNIFMDDGEAVKIGDFGLAHIDDEKSLTTAEELLGTSAYMSPELIRGDNTSWLADQYALGITAYELLAGQRPYKAASIEAQVYQYLSSPVPDIRSMRRDVTPETSALVRKMMAKEPSDRFESYEALISNLEFTEMGLKSPK